MWLEWLHLLLIHSPWVLTSLPSFILARSVDAEVKLSDFHISIPDRSSKGGSGSGGSGVARFELRDLDLEESSAQDVKVRAGVLVSFTSKDSSSRIRACTEAPGRDRVVPDRPRPHPGALDPPGQGADLMLSLLAPCGRA